MRRSSLILILVFLASLGSYASLWPTAPLSSKDTSGYQEVARDLADLRIDQVHYRTVGYPLLLLATRSVDTPTRTLFYVGLGFHFVAIALLLLALSRYEVSWLGRAVFLLVLLLPPFVEPAGYALAENLAEFTLAIGVGTLALAAVDGHLWLAVTSGLALAISGLVRPTYQLAGIGVACSLLLLAAILPIASVRRFRSILVALVGANVLIVGGCAASNQAKFGYFGLTPGIGFNLSTKTSLFVEDLPARYGPVKTFLIAQRDSELLRHGGAHTAEQYMWDLPRNELESLTGLSGVPLQRYVLRLNLDLIKRNPMRYAEHVLRAVGRQMLPSSGKLANEDSRLLQLVWVAVHILVLAGFLGQLVVIAGLIVFVAAVPRGVPLKTLVAAHVPALFTYVAASCLIIYTVAVTALVDIGSARQRTPVDILVVFVTVLGYRIWRSLANDVSQGVLHSSTDMSPALSGMGQDAIVDVVSI